MWIDSPRQTLPKHRLLLLERTNESASWRKDDHVEDGGDDDNGHDDGDGCLLENPQQVICNVVERKSAAKCIFSLSKFFCKFLFLWYAAGRSCVVGIIVHQKLLFMSKTHSLLVHDNNS